MRSWFEWENIQTIAFLLLFFGPVTAAIVLGAALYDDRPRVRPAPHPVRPPPSEAGPERET